ncbi:MAG TPA: peroxiredoxin [Longimicrobiaceae bacterium]|nr:peroxiredoxin [Longimicrobiaceae bacterium]
MSATDTLLNAGSDAPNFTAKTTDGDTVSLHDFRGKRNVLLMFYPKDDTPGCTRQMCAARDEGAEYEAAHVVRFGVNDGDLASHEHFRDKYSLDFPLIVDEGKEIARAYGTLGENGWTARSTFLIDTHGRIVYAAPGAHGADEVLEAIRG